MMDVILNKLGIGDGAMNGVAEARRRHVRHVGRQAEVVVADKAYSVRDWSKSGVFFETQPDSRIIAGDRLQLTLQFRLPHETISVNLPGRVVRAARRGIAAEFLPFTTETRRAFDRAIDGFNAQSFLESQVA